jgi:antitoxin (DNA-binding transcriptional repressor) of toxin-antitoxin stability system
MMRSVNISTLRGNLSRLLDAVRRGQTLQILDRDIPIAQIVPIASQPASSDDAPLIERLRRSGVAQVGTLERLPHIVGKLPPGPRHTGAVDALLAERRSGR